MNEYWIIEGKGTKRYNLLIPFTLKFKIIRTTFLSLTNPPSNRNLYSNKEIHTEKINQYAIGLTNKFINKQMNKGINKSVTVFLSLFIAPS